jgi:hypothetical protein
MVDFLTLQSVRLLFDSMPLTKGQIDRAVSNGANRDVLVEASRVVRRRFRLIQFTELIIFFLYPYGLATTVWHLQLHPRTVLPILIFLAFFSLYIIGDFHFGMGSSRRRLLLHVTRLIHLLTAWDTSSRQSKLLVIIARGQTDFPTLAAIKLRRLAWPVARDLALRDGGDKSVGMREPWVNSGKVLTWISDRVSDPRRRIYGWELAAELSFFLSDSGARPPQLLISAAAKCTIQQSHRQKLLIVLEVIKAPLLVGIVLAVATAILRLLVK